MVSAQLKNELLSENEKTLLIRQRKKNLLTLIVLVVLVVAITGLTLIFRLY